MTEPLPQTLFVVLSDGESTGRISVEFEAYVRFRTQMERGLAALEAAFAHLSPRRFRGERGQNVAPHKAK